MIVHEASYCSNSLLILIDFYMSLMHQPVTITYKTSLQLYSTNTRMSATERDPSAHRTSRSVARMRILQKSFSKLFWFVSMFHVSQFDPNFFVSRRILVASSMERQLLLSYFQCNIRLSPITHGSKSLFSYWFYLLGVLVFFFNCICQESRITLKSGLATWAQSLWVAFSEKGGI